MRREIENHSEHELNQRVCRTHWPDATPPALTSRQRRCEGAGRETSGRLDQLCSPRKRGPSAFIISLLSRLDLSGPRASCSLSKLALTSTKRLGAGVARALGLARPLRCISSRSKFYVEANLLIDSSTIPNFAQA